MTRIDLDRYSRNVADYLRDTCKRKGIPQSDWPHLFGFTKQAVTEWHKGRSYPDFGSLMAIANHFQENLDFIVGWKPKRHADILPYKQ